MSLNLHPVEEFLIAASVPRDYSHASGTLQRANAILAAHPDVSASSIYAAAVLGDDAGVQRFLSLSPDHATARGGPYGWDALTYLCFSRYLRLDAARSAAFERAAAALLDGGADASTGWWEPTHQPNAVWESALYGAAGVAQHAGVTRLLLERGADPNDEETPYHVPETYDLAVLRVLLASGRLNAESMSTLLLRKADWHDTEGVRLLLEHGADPNRMTRWGFTALHQAIRRDNDLAKITLMFDHGADPRLLTTQENRSAASLAAQRGRGDVLALFDSRGFQIDLEGVERLLAVCARDDARAIEGEVARQPGVVSKLIADGGSLLSIFAGNDNAAGVGHLLDLGVPVDVFFLHGDGYFGIAPLSTALHVAVWRACHAAVALLLARGASVNRRDGSGRSALQLAIRACVDSYWSGRRSPRSVELLLAAGASVDGIVLPTGYDAIDGLLAPRLPQARP